MAGKLAAVPKRTSNLFTLRLTKTLDTTAYIKWTNWMHRRFDDAPICAKFITVGKCPYIPHQWVDCPCFWKSVHNRVLKYQHSRSGLNFFQGGLSRQDYTMIPATSSKLAFFTRTTDAQHEILTQITGAGACWFIPQLVRPVCKLTLIQRYGMFSDLLATSWTVWFEHKSV